MQASGTETQKEAVIGFYALSCQPASPTTLGCGVGASFATGEIFAQSIATGDTTGSTLTGTVDGGTGAYQAATGTLTGTLLNSTTADVTIRLS